MVRACQFLGQIEHQPGHQAGHQLFQQFALAVNEIAKPVARSDPKCLLNFKGSGVQGHAEARGHKETHRI